MQGHPTLTQRTSHTTQLPGPTLFQFFSVYWWWLNREYAALYLSQSQRQALGPEGFMDRFKGHQEGSNGFAKSAKLSNAVTLRFMEFA